MKKEQYIRAVLRKLDCTGQKKKEIEKELCADIQTAMDEGAAWEEIRIRMGEPEEAAAEFNENFSEQEIKKAKRNKRFLIAAVSAVILAVFLAAAYWALPKGGLADEEDYPHDETFAKVQKIISLVEKEDYDAIREEYANEIMKGLMSDEQMDAAKKAVGSQWGKRVSFGNFYVSNIEQMGEKHLVTQLNVSYEHASVTYTISFDEAGKLAGLYMK